MPVKYSSTTSEARPTASKICAPVYEATVETPILDMILITPLQAALMYCVRARRGVTPSRVPAAIMSSIVSKAR